MADTFSTLSRLGTRINEEFGVELSQQGHKLTGKLIASMTSTVNPIPNGFEIVGMMNDYGLVVDNGVKRERIPFRGRGGGGKSRYIQGLVQFVKARGIASGNKEALKVAFAIANAHKKEGMSTQASKKFSKTGERQGFRDATFNRMEAEIGQAVGFAAEVDIDNAFNEMIK